MSNLEQEEQTILQWNCQGVRNKKEEILHLIQQYKPLILALQETKLHETAKFTIPVYTGYRKEGHYNRQSHGGVAIYIHETIPHRQVELTTTIQAVAVRAQLHKPITVCNIYISRQHDMNKKNLHDLVQQLPQPIILMGDINSYNTIWGSRTTDTRGRIIEAFINESNLNILNNGDPTRIAYNAETAIDITISSPSLQPEIKWNAFDTPLDSDHCPIKITFISNENQLIEDSKKINIKTANWGKYKEHEVWKNLPRILTNNENNIEDLYARFEQATNETMKEYKQAKFFPKPWWTKEVQDARNKRERLYQAYKRNKSLTNIIAWKRARAEFKSITIQSKKESWEKFTGTVNKNTPISKVWETIRKIKGRKERTIPILTENSKHFTKPKEIVNKLAETFSNISSTNSYSERFKQIQKAAEKVPLNFTPSYEEHYNQIITMEEFQYALRKTKNTSPGPDKIYAQMIKNMPENAHEYLLKLLNRMYVEPYFPNQWRESTIVPIPKPNKNHSDPSNYRPIALTSILCKIMERIVNARLVDYLEMENKLHNIQCGSRKKRSTLDHLVRLETTIRHAFAKNEHFISIFFDLEKAYDLTWRRGIMRDLHRMGLRGRLPLYIQEFLSNRTFNVRINNTTSEKYTQETGIPQGSVLSVTLFIIKINEIANQVPKEAGFHSSLFVDDLQIGYQHQDLNIIHEKLQSCLNSVHQWAETNGCRFSEGKTNVMHFTMKPGLHPTPNLTLNSKVLQYKENIKFLGMTWDAKLTWRPHINILKANCNNALNLLKSITSQQWGADQKSLLMIYRALIRSKLDYGAIVYQSANQTSLHLVDSIASEALRIATGAFKSTPVETLHIIANELPLKLRREKQTLKYFFKIRSIITNPACKCVVNPTNRMLYENKHLPITVALRAENLLRELNINKQGVKPEFLYSIFNIKTPTWRITTPKINLELAELSRDITPNEHYQQEYARIKDQRYAEFKCIYTDGSKSEQGVGAAVVCERKRIKATLPSEATVYSSEIHAITMAVSFIRNEESNKYVIFSDSLSTLCKLDKANYSHPAIRKIQHDIDDMKRQKTVEFCWIPGHVGIKGNEEADKEAKSAATKQPEFILINYTDWYPVIDQKINEKWNNIWKASNRTMLKIKPDNSNWDEYDRMTRKEEVILNRLRAAHTWIAHNYLMSGDIQGAVIPCQVCHRAHLNVEHFLMQCPDLQAQQRNIFGESFTDDPNFYRRLLTASNMRHKLMSYLKEIGIYDLI